MIPCPSGARNRSPSGARNRCTSAEPNHCHEEPDHCHEPSRSPAAEPNRCPSAQPKHREEPNPRPSADPSRSPGAADPSPCPSAAEPNPCPSAADPNPCPSAADPNPCPSAADPNPCPSAADPNPCPSAADPNPCPSAADPNRSPGAAAASPDYRSAPPRALARRPGAGAGPAGLPDGRLPRRGQGGRPRRVGRHRSLHRISVASDAPALVLAVPGRGDAIADLAGRIADAAMDSCPGVQIRIGFLDGSTETLGELLGSEAGLPASSGFSDFPDLNSTTGHGRRAASSAPGQEPGPASLRPDQAPEAVVVPLLAGPHPGYDAAIAAAIGSAASPVMLATSLGPHPLLAGALHDRLHDVGLARAGRARGLNIAAGATGIIVVADRGPQALADAGVSTLLLASRLAVPAAPASLGDPASIDAAVTRLRRPAPRTWRCPLA